jgi:hypothetical protein
VYGIEPLPLEIHSGMTIRLRAPSHLTVSVVVLLAGVLGAVPARAEVPSVDAYAGQALVLGGGTHHHKGGSGTGGGQSGAGSGATHSATGGAATGSSGSSTVGSSHSQATGSTTKGTASGKPASDAGGRETAAAGSRRSSTGAIQSGGTASSGRSGALSPSATLSAEQSEGGGFTTMDVLLLVLGAACLVGVATVLRMARRSSRTEARRT